MIVRQNKTSHRTLLLTELKPLTIITKCSILDVAVVLDPPLIFTTKYSPQNSTLLLTRVLKRHDVTHERNGKLSYKNIWKLKLGFLIQVSISALV